MGPSTLCTHCWSQPALADCKQECLRCDSAPQPTLAESPVPWVTPLPAKAKKSRWADWFRNLFIAAGGSGGQQRCRTHPDEPLVVSCPECQQPIDSRFDPQRGVAFVGIVGPRGAGKTHLLTTFVSEANQHKQSASGTEQSPIALTPLGPTAQKFLQLRTVLYEKRSRLAATPPAQQDRSDTHNFCWQVTHDEGKRARNGKLLAQMDVGGETWQHDARPSVEFMRYANGLRHVVFAVDGQTLARMVGVETHDAWDKSSSDLEHHQEALSRLTTLLGPEAAQQTRIAITLTKADLLEASGRDPVELLREQFRSLILDAKANYRDVDLFATSSLGATPTSEGPLRTPPQPKDVLKPFLWALDVRDTRNTRRPAKRAEARKGKPDGAKRPTRDTRRTHASSLELERSQEVS